MEQKKRINIIFSNDQIKKNRLEYYLKFSDDLSISFYDCKNQANQEILRHILKEHHTKMADGAISFYV